MPLNGIFNTLTKLPIENTEKMHYMATCK